ncbi:hypothetical protein GPALN_004870 [Globodera pallida]|nr:hypothetical protein GPALN_004870 [Globodera pallida]
MIKFKKNLTFINNRYQIAMPWNDHVNKLPTNYYQVKTSVRHVIEVRAAKIRHASGTSGVSVRCTKSPNPKLV